MSPEERNARDEYWKTERLFKNLNSKGKKSATGRILQERMADLYRTVVTISGDRNWNLWQDAERD